MRPRLGDRLRCSNPACHLEVSVSDAGQQLEVSSLLHCCCGFPMKKAYQKPLVTKVAMTHSEKAPR